MILDLQMQKRYPMSVLHDLTTCRVPRKGKEVIQNVVDAVNNTVHTARQAQKISDSDQKAMKLFE